MSRFVLDSSVILAVLNQEPGSENLDDYFVHGSVSAVNAAEVLTKLMEKGQNRETALTTLDLVRLDIVDFDRDQSITAAELRAETKGLGLSLGDRACLAAAIELGATAVTADRGWKDLACCPIDLIR